MERVKNFLSAKSRGYAVWATIVLLFCGGFTSRSLAQTVTSFISSANADNTLAGSVQSIHAVNCDMLDLYEYFNDPIGTDKLWAVTFGQEKGSPLSPTTPGLYVGASYGSSDYNNLNIPIPYIGSGSTATPNDAYDPDVVVGNYSDVNGLHYFVAVVYCDGIGEVYMDAYELDLSSYPTISIANTIVGHLHLSTGTGMGEPMPHIDLCADPSGYSGGTYSPYMHKFAVVWSDNAIYAVVGDIAAMPSTLPTSPSQLTLTGAACDVGCTLDPFQGTETAYVVYNNGWAPSTNYFIAFDMSSVTPIGSTYTGVIATPYIGFHEPRIDAATLYDMNDPDAGVLWHAVDYATYAHPSGGIYSQLWHADMGNYTSGCGGTNYFNTYFDYFNPLSYYPPCGSCIQYDNNTPAVCGTNNFLGGGVAPSDNDFTVGFYGYGANSMGTYDDYFVTQVGNQFCSPGSGGSTPGLTAYQVNYSPLLNSFYYGSSGTYGAAVGVATCTNTGFNQLTAWYTGDGGNPYAGEIRYKFGGTSYSYKHGKETGITDNPMARVSVYPNPANNVLNVRGISNGTYTITNAVGQTVLNGNIMKDAALINIDQLVKGFYILNLQENGTNRKVKFTKE